MNRNTVNRRPKLAKVLGDEDADGVTSLVPGVKDSRPRNSRAYTIGLQVVPAKHEHLRSRGWDH